MSNFQFNPLQMAIRPFYEQAIAEDELFAREVKEKEARTEKPKSLAECCEYIMGEAYKYASEHKMGNFGLAGCEDSQITAMIKHYYDEDDIKIHKFGSSAKASVKTTGDSKATKKAQEQEKKAKKPIRPKETLNCVNVPMIRPVSKRDAKKGSREQAKQVDVMDMFAGMWETEEAEVAEVVDDIPE